MPLDLDDPDLLADMEPPPNGVLYHYTTAAGLTGIVKSGPCLQATCHRFVNDAGEIRFGFEIALDVLASVDRLAEKVITAATARINKMRTEDSYLACLSSEHDVLSQWRNYADNCAGYCIGFRTKTRAEAYGDSDDNLWTSNLYQCIYDRDLLREHLDARYRRKIELSKTDDFKRRIAASRSKLDEPKRRIEALALDLADVAWRYAHIAKHEHFREEKEWRYVVGAPQSHLSYRMTKRGLAAYLDTQTLELAEVWIGPSARAIPKEDVTRFLTIHGVDATVEYWDSPVR